MHQTKNLDRLDKSKNLLKELSNHEITIKQINQSKIVQNHLQWKKCPNDLASPDMGGEPKPGKDSCQVHYYDNILCYNNKVVKVFYSLFLVFIVFQTVVYYFFYAIATFEVFGYSLKKLRVGNNIVRQIEYKIKLKRELKQLLKGLLSPGELVEHSQFIRTYLRFYSILTFLIIDTVLGMAIFYLCAVNIGQLITFIHRIGFQIHI